MVRQHDLIEFIRRKLGYDTLTDEEVLRYISDHIRYKTISIVSDNGKIVGLLRINIFGTVADVADVAVEDGYNAQDIIRQMSIELWNNFPYVKYFELKRLRKYPLKKPRIYTIKRLLKVK